MIWSRPVLHIKRHEIVFYGNWPESRGLVTGEDGEPVNVQDDDEEVFNGEEDQHLMYHIKVYHDNQANYQEGSVLDEQSFHGAPDACPEVQEA